MDFLRLSIVILFFLIRGCMRYFYNLWDCVNSVCLVKERDLKIVLGKF